MSRPVCLVSDGWKEISETKTTAGELDIVSPIYGCPKLPLAQHQVARLDVPVHVTGLVHDCQT